MDPHAQNQEMLSCYHNMQLAENQVVVAPIEEKKVSNMDKNLKLFQKREKKASFA